MVQDSKTTTKRNKKVSYTFAVGRRREAVARVRLYSASVTLGTETYQKGDVIVNNLPFGTYFAHPALSAPIKEFFDTIGALNKYVYSIRVVGGGKKGQLDAILQGLARALVKEDKEKHHETLRDKGYLTRDARTRERRKVGMGGKARRKKQSPKR